ncbi:MAG TPA: hypothetical protein VFW83_02795 [Bryobacteraceae bacterium]|nr:hypothetical protein [Bryobacteraceae bacterium]
MNWKRSAVLMAIFTGLGLAQGKQASPSSANIELTVYLISGLAQGQTADNVPSNLAPTMRQLHNLFTYKSYKLADSFILRGRAGSRASTEGRIPGNAGRYEFSYRSAWISAQSPNVVHIDRMYFSIVQTTPDGKIVTNNFTAQMQTDIDAREGQETVVGKSSINNVGDALILVIVTKVIE